MHLAEAVTILVSGILCVRMTDRLVFIIPLGELAVDDVFVGVD